MSPLLIINLLYALGYPLSKIAAETSQPLFLIGICMTLTGLILMGYSCIKMRRFALPIASLAPLGLAGIFCMYLYNAFALWGLASVTATRAAFIDNCAPLISAFLEWLIFKDKLSTLEWVGITMATLGTMPIMGASSALSSSTSLLAGNLSSGDLWIMLSNIASVYGYILMRRASSETNNQPLLANGFSMFIGGICALAHSCISEPWAPLISSHAFSASIYVLLMIIVYNGVVDNLYSFLAQRYTVTTLMLSSFTVPIFTAFFDWLFFGMTISSTFWMSTALIFAGLLCCLKKHTLEHARPASIR